MDVGGCKQKEEKITTTGDTDSKTIYSSDPIANTISEIVSKMNDSDNIPKFRPKLVAHSNSGQQYTVLPFVINNVSPNDNGDGVYGCILEQRHPTPNEPDDEWLTVPNVIKLSIVALGTILLTKHFGNKAEAYLKGAAFGMR